MKIVEAKIDDVKPYPNNPRTISSTAVDRVAKSLKEFGFQQPIVVDKDYVIIVGHTRYRAAKQLGMETVPIQVADNLTPEQIKAYRIADNKTGELTGWDDVLLRKELELLEALNVDMDMTAFTEAELLKALAPPDSNVTGSKELDAGDFQKFEHKCPRCGFEYDKDAEPGAEKKTEQDGEEDKD